MTVPVPFDLTSTLTSMSIPPGLLAIIQSYTSGGESEAWIPIPENKLHTNAFPIDEKGGKVRSSCYKAAIGDQYVVKVLLDARHAVVEKDCQEPSSFIHVNSRLTLTQDGTGSVAKLTKGKHLKKQRGGNS